MALRFELTRMKEYVEKVDPKNIFGKEIMHGFFGELITIIPQEAERIKDELRESVINIKKEHQKKEYVLHHLVNVIRLYDKVYQFLLPKERKSLYSITNEMTAENTYKQLFICLEDILHFIQKDFPDCFDKRVKVPQVYRWELQDEIEEQLDNIKNELVKCGVEEGLIEVAVMPLAGLLVNEAEICYHSYEFLRALLKKISAFSNSVQSANPTDKFLKILWRLNYNSVWLYNYIVVSYDAIVKEAANLHDAIYYLQQQEKTLKQTTVRTDIAYRREQPGITHLLLGWLDEELRLLKEMEANKKLMKQWGKIVTILSVEELGYGCRLLHGQGLFPDIEETELLELVASSFCTPKSKEISTDSIKNKSGKPGPNAKQRVKDHLYDMARKVR